MHSPVPAASDAIITPELLLEAIAGVREFRAVTGTRTGPLATMEGEPALREFLHGSLLEIAGRMGLSGCSPEIISNVHQEMSFLLAVTFEAVGQAHRRLFADVMPEDGAGGPSDECSGCETTEG